ncbi:sulfotransferase [Streptomyces sp. WMMC500]|uniref:sulfotransferase family protein n=1 Tax=Streptomyces sp. WMMC500 TaxID=3015154 RepID=UPI00248D100A|nr:sulfotransferase [Streptomyces sp. WMMC500]WBB63593.1 sulfotransferase [Streptomyces sp. WMMC500]
MRMNTVGKGLRRRGRLMAQALGPRRRAPRPSPAPPRAKARPEAYRAPRAPRLVPSPVFVLSSVRSGSTLLRVLLNSHPEIRAPHEMHLRTLRVELTRPYSAKAMEGLELDRRELEHLLWDRVLHMELERSGKRVIVDKTPANALIRDRLADCWPDARFLVLLRHPGAVVSSLVNRRKEPDLDAIHAEVLDYGEALEAARTGLGAAGHVLRYEDLTAEPAGTARGICEFLGVEWAPEMLDYGAHDHGTFRPHLGDWSSNIKSGRIQPARAGDHDAGLTGRLAELAELWGYRRAG